MDLSEFISLSTAERKPDGKWVVGYSMNGGVSAIVVNDCNSEYEAKERVYLGLIADKEE